MVELGITKWRALVIQSSGPQYEAMIYQLLNGRDGRKPINSWELFQAALVARDPVAEAAQRAVVGAGLTLKKGSRGGALMETQLPSVGMVYRLTQRHGEEVITRGLKLLTNTWPMQIETMNDVFTYACIQLCASQGDQLDDRYFAEKLGRIPPRKILLDSALSQDRSRGRLALGLRTVIKLYNRKTARSMQLELDNAA